jgi:hypothetical protein
MGSGFGKGIRTLFKTQTYLFYELFATFHGTRRPLLYLSDGGHFENLGLYELVRRRCRLIVVCDAGCDPAPFGFEDLGNAVRKCRNDFGAEIHLDLAPLVAADDERRRFAIGRIDYAAGGTGVLVYVKPLVAGDEPADILRTLALVDLTSLGLFDATNLARPPG